MSKLSKKEQQLKLEDLMDEFGLNHVKKNLGRNLSGGKKEEQKLRDV